MQAGYRLGILLFLLAFIMLIICWSTPASDKVRYYYGEKILRDSPIIAKENGLEITEAAENNVQPSRIFLLQRMAKQEGLDCRVASGNIVAELIRDGKRNYR